MVGYFLLAKVVDINDCFPTYCTQSLSYDHCVMLRSCVYIYISAAKAECDSQNMVYILFCAKFPNAVNVAETSNRFRFWLSNHKPRRGYGTLPWWRGLRESRTTATIPKTFNDIGKAQSETPDEDHVQPNPSNSHWASAEGMAHPFLSWVTPKNKYRPFLLGQRI